MSRSPLALAIVGCGDVARYTAWFARLNRGIRLTACCDSVAERAAHFARRFRIPQVYGDLSELLSAGPRPDALYLAVPHHLHHPLALQAIAAGIPVLLEKPLARTLAEGQRDRGRGRGGRGQGGGELPVPLRRRLLRAGPCRAGRRAGRDPLRPLQPPLASRRANTSPTGGWHARLATAGGGTLITQGSHLLDVVLWALGGRPAAALGATARRVFSQVEVEDLALGIIEMADGALVEVCSSMVAHAEQGLSIEVYGSRGTATYGNRPWPHVRFRVRHVAPDRGRRRVPPGGGIHALQRSLEGFRAWIVDDRPLRTPYLIPADEALPVLAAVDAIYRSSRTGHREEVTL